MALELPGIYLQTDSDKVFVFDSVEVKVVTRDNSGVVLEIRNPTAYDANISILAERARHARQPLGFTAFLNWSKIGVKAGETRTVAVFAHGNSK
jgi:hypothetical protein